MPEESAPTATDPTPPTVVRSGAAFHGLVSLSRPGRIDGRVEGDVVAARSIWISETGRVAGRVEAEDVVIAGELEGEVFGRRRIELLPTARVVANLHAPRVILAEGAYLEGTCTSGAGTASVEDPTSTAETA